MRLALKGHGGVRETTIFARRRKLSAMAERISSQSTVSTLTCDGDSHPIESTLPGDDDSFGKKIEPYSSSNTSYSGYPESLFTQPGT